MEVKERRWLVKERAVNTAAPEDLRAERLCLGDRVTAVEPAPGALLEVIRARFAEDSLHLLHGLSSPRPAPYSDRNESKARGRRFGEERRCFRGQRKPFIVVSHRGRSGAGARRCTATSRSALRVYGRGLGRYPAPGGPQGKGAVSAKKGSGSTRAKGSASARRGRGRQRLCPTDPRLAAPPRPGDSRPGEPTDRRRTGSRELLLGEPEPDLLGEMVDRPQRGMGPNRLRLQCNALIGR